MERISDIIKDRIVSQKTIVIADACHSGGIGSDFRGISTPDLYTEFGESMKKYSGKAILTASRARELSQELAEFEQGVFTYYLIEGLNGKADNDNDGIVTLSEIYDYVYENVKEVTGGIQHPDLKGNYDNNLPLSIIAK